jgi:hypothetical protein
MPWLDDPDSSVVIHSSIFKLLSDRNCHKVFLNLPEFTNEIFKAASIFYDFNHEAKFNLGEVFPQKKTLG